MSNLEPGRFSERITSRLTMLIVALISLFSTSLLAQSTQSFDEFQSKLNEGVARIAQYQSVLQNPDARVQYEAVRLMLQSGDPALRRIAKEHALFSTNPVMRNSAIEAIFDGGGNIRLEVAAVDDTSSKVFDWVVKIGGSHDGRIGNLILPLGTKSGNCWMQVRYNKYCQLSVSGTTVQFANNGNSGEHAQATLSLGPDGVLRGVLLSNNGQASASIDLKE
jgi:hypothetical protein